MIKRTVDNRQTFIGKVWLYHYGFVCWFYSLHQERGKTIFSRLYNVFEENAGLILVDFVIFLLLHANPPACLKIVVRLASLQVQINTVNTHK